MHRYLPLLHGRRLGHAPKGQVLASNAALVMEPVRKAVVGWTVVVGGARIVCCDRVERRTVSSTVISSHSYFPTRGVP